MTTPRHVVRRTGSVVLAAALAVGAAVAPATPSSAAGAAVTKSETVTRIHLVNGADQPIDSRRVTLTVDQTTALRDRQEVTVSWTGAHPTGGLVADTNSGAAAFQEYPMVLMECRGVASTKVPASQQIAPSTCWTQTPDERAQQDQFVYPSFRMDRYASASDRAMQVGVPKPLPKACTGINGAQHWIPFVGADGKVYRGGPKIGCAGIAPEAVAYEGQLQPGNTTYAATDVHGHGSTKFVISTTETNESLGCSATVACSLVAVPIEGISCDAAGAGMPAADRPDATGTSVSDVMAHCGGTGVYKPGQQSFGNADPDSTPVTGALWWSPSNWRNRIVMPLSFARTNAICDLLTKSPTSYIYGSELLSQATEQWAPTFCTNKSLFKLQHIHTAEPEAVNLLRAGSVEAAVAGRPEKESFPRPVVQVPTALTGFAVSYRVDDANGRPYHDLKLTPRLLAKLITESYPSSPTVKGEVDYLSGNPVDITQDPEFKALNPGLPAPGYNTQPAATLSMVSSDSDVIAALTDYIVNDPDARTWLSGKPDPWGMVVNPAYNLNKQQVSLPTSSWPQLDESKPTTLYRPDINPCLADSPVPILPLVASPVSSFAAITLNLQFDIASSQIICANAGQQNQKLVAVGRETPGQRFILGLTTLGDAERYQFDDAALETHVDASAPETFTDSNGRTFVRPTTVGLRAAAAGLAPDAAAGTWAMPYDKLRTDPAAAAAYPGTMLVNTVVPTRGLPTDDATRLSKFLDFAAGPGQVPGFGNGQLPRGYLPMTAANGLGQQVAYARAAASYVAAQNGAKPNLLHPKVAPAAAGVGASVGSTGRSSGSVGASGTGSVGSGTSAPPPAASEPVTPPVGAPVHGTGTPTVARQPVPVVNAGVTSALGEPTGSLALPLILLTLLAAGTASAALGLTRGRP